MRKCLCCLALQERVQECTCACIFVQAKACMHRCMCAGMNVSMVFGARAGVPVSSYVCMHGYTYVCVLDECISTHASKYAGMCARMDGWIDGWMDGRTDGRMDGWLAGWLAGWVDGWMDGWMDGWTAIHMYVCLHVRFFCL